MFSNIFCETLETSAQDSKLAKQDDFGLKLYKIELFKYYELASSLLSLLSHSESIRAIRYHFLKDRNRFIICRAILKVLLADYIGVPNNKVIIDKDSNKKPYVRSHPSVFFNVSHSGDYALIAIAKHPIGIDIEYINKNFAYTEILKNVFAPIEIDEIAISTNKYATFYKFWTRKEAIVKAIGKGIDDDLIQIPITDGLHSLSSSLICHYEMISIFSFNINHDYIGALAVTEDIQDYNEIVFNSLPTLEALKSLILEN